jgi:hypothetical protein
MPAKSQSRAAALAHIQPAHGWAGIRKGDESLRAGPPAIKAGEIQKGTASESPVRRGCCTCNI